MNARAQKDAFKVGFYASLIKAAEGTGDQWSWQLDHPQMSTLADVPSLLETENAETATQTKLRILKDPSLSKVQRNALIAQLESRAPGDPARSLLASNTPDEMQLLLNSYLQTRGHPGMSSFLQQVLRMGATVASALGSGYRVKDRRKRPDQERYSRWKMSFFD